MPPVPSRKVFTPPQRALATPQAAPTTCEPPGLAPGLRSGFTKPPPACLAAGHYHHLIKHASRSICPLSAATPRVLHRQQRHPTRDPNHALHPQYITPNGPVAFAFTPPSSSSVAIPLAIAPVINHPLRTLHPRLSTSSITSTRCVVATLVSRRF